MAGNYTIWCIYNWNIPSSISEMVTNTEFPLELRKKSLTEGWRLSRDPRGSYWDRWSRNRALRELSLCQQRPGQYWHFQETLKCSQERRVRLAGAKWAEMMRLYWVWVSCKELKFNLMDFYWKISTQVTWQHLFEGPSC